MERNSPSKQAYEYLSEAEHGRHLQEMQESIHAKMRAAWNRQVEDLDTTLTSQGPLSALSTFLLHSYNSQVAFLNTNLFIIISCNRHC